MLLSQREQHLKEELLRCREDGERALKERVEKGLQLHVRSERVAAMSDRELNQLRQDIKVPPQRFSQSALALLQRKICPLIRCFLSVLTFCPTH